jgi:hypothetical protein
VVVVGGHRARAGCASRRWHDGVSIDLVFTRLFRSRSVIRFSLTEEGEATRVIWRMESPRTFFSRFFDLDKLVGGDFEKGLRQLKQVAEGR